MSIFKEIYENGKKVAELRFINQHDKADRLEKKTELLILSLEVMYSNK